MTDERRIEVGTAADGAPVSLPVEQVLTGRGFLTGKSGVGKSNTASVVSEELLERGYPLMVVDTDGEYYGLKERYELLHVGADGECDLQVSDEHAGKLAELALEGGTPVVLDVSGYLEEGEARDLIRETARELFAKAKKLKRPFLLVVEEVHEYIPEGGGMDDTGRMLIKVGKRGRKHGLGIVGISQRPADVKKDFITQANWLVWHRLTWDNDTDVVGRVIGEEYADAVPGLDDGEAFVQRDWTDSEVTRVQFDRKRTFDAGATPGLEEFERPELKSVSDALVDELEAISERERREESRIEELERTLEEREARIAELEDELASARDVSRAARQLASAFSGGDAADAGERLRRKDDRIEALEAQVEALRERLDADGTDRPDGRGTPEAGSDGVRSGEDVDAHVERLRRKGSRPDAAGIPGDPRAVTDLLGADPVAARIDDAIREAPCNREHAWTVIAALASHGALGLDGVRTVVDVPTEAIGDLLSELASRSIVDRDDRRRYSLDREAMEELIDAEGERAALGELGRQWEV